jgi:hypothetical protein
MVYALLGAEGSFGVKGSADRLLPDLIAPPTGTSGASESSGTSGSGGGGSGTAVAPATPAGK